MTSVSKVLTLLVVAGLVLVSLPAFSGVLSVADLDRAKDVYAGKNVRVQGKILITPRISTIACPPAGPCDRVIGVDLALAPAGSTTPSNLPPPIPIYQNGNPYPCTHAGETIVACGRFRHGEITTVDGTYVKTQIPSQGYSSGGVATVLSWRAFYYLEVN